MESNPNEVELVVPLAFVFGGFFLAFLLPWSESRAGGTQTPWTWYE